MKKENGHSIYKSLRRSLQYEEAASWNFGHERHWKAHYDNRVRDSDRENFGDNITTMLNTYRDVKADQYHESVRKAIDTSKWYKDIKDL